MIANLNFLINQPISQQHWTVMDNLSSVLHFQFSSHAELFQCHFKLTLLEGFLSIYLTYSCVLRHKLRKFKRRRRESATYSEEK